MKTGRSNESHPDPRTWRTTATVVALALITLTTFGFTSPSGASEFNPDPSAAASASCDGGPHFHLSLGNQGQGPADFHIQVADATDQSTPVDQHEVVVAGGGTIVDVPGIDHHHETLTIASSGMADVIVDHTFDCEGLAAHIAISCGLQGVNIDYQLTNPDVVAHDFALADPGTQPWVVSVPAGAVKAGYSIDGIDRYGVIQASVTVGGSVISSLDVDPDCFAPQASAVFECGADGPQVTVHMANAGQSRALMQWAVDSHLQWVSVFEEILAGAPATDHVIPLEEDQTYTATVVDYFSGDTIAKLTGVADCEPDATVPSTEPTPDPIPDPLPAPTPPDTTPVLVAAVPTAQPVVTPVAVDPQFTG